MSELVLREDRDGVATLTLNRPEALNALNVPPFAELREHVAAIAAETDTVGCVVLRGEGRAFSAGNDLKALGTPAPEPYYQAETIDMIEALPQPVIASVRGACYTGALELMLAADLCIAGESAIFCDSHGEWALTPLWGLTQRLPRRIGPLLAREMMYTARRVDAHEAVRIGLANRVVPDAELDEAERLKLVHELGALLADDVPWIPLYMLPNLLAWDPEVVEGPGKYVSSVYGGFYDLYDWTVIG